MKIKLRTFLCVLALIPLLVSVEVNATIYKCVNAKAEVFYNDKPCSVTTIERSVKAVKDPKNGYVPPAFVEESTKQNKRGIVVGDSKARLANSINNKGSGNNTSKKGGGSSNGGTSGYGANNVAPRQVTSAKQVVTNNADNNSNPRSTPSKLPKDVSNYVTE